MRNSIFPISIFSLLLAISCQEQVPKQEKTDEKTSRQETYNVYLEIKEYETKKLDIYTVKADYSGDTTFIYDFKVNFFDRDTISAVMTGDTGVIVENQGFMEAKGQVKLATPGGDSLLSSTLIWNQSSNIIYSPTESILYKNNKVIRSTGLESDPALRNIKFRGKVYVE